MWRLVLLVAAAATLAACSGGDTGDRPRVVAAFYPLAWVAERVAGDAYEVVDLTPPGAEPHDLELSPRDVETVEDAELVVYVGGGFQPAVEDAVDRREGRSLDVLPPGERDPHIWLDPVRLSLVVDQIAAALDRPERAREVTAALELLDAELRTGLAHCARTSIVTTHSAFGHLATRYGLEQVSLGGLAPESEPAPRELERLIEQVTRTGATTVFAEPLVSHGLAETVAREAGASVALLDPLEGLSEDRLDAGEDYLSVMRDNLAALREGLGCR